MTAPPPVSDEVDDSFRWVSSLCFGYAGIKRGHLAAFFCNRLHRSQQAFKYTRSMNIDYTNRIEDAEGEGMCESWRKAMKPRNQAQKHKKGPDSMNRQGPTLAPIKKGKTKRTMKETLKLPELT